MSKYKLKTDRKISMSWCFSAAVESSDYICINIVHVVKPRPIMLKILPIMLLSSAQETNPLCSILCPQLLQLCHSSFTI